MPTKRTDTPADPEYPKAGLTGPADTDDPGVRVTTAQPQPSDYDRRRGATPAAAAVGHHEPPTPPLRLTSEPRIETYDLQAPGGTPVAVTHNIDTGEATYDWGSSPPPHDDAA